MDCRGARIFARRAAIAGGIPLNTPTQKRGRKSALGTSVTLMREDAASRATRLTVAAYSQSRNAG